MYLIDLILQNYSWVAVYIIGVVVMFFVTSMLDGEGEVKICDIPIIILWPLFIALLFVLLLLSCIS